MDLLPVNPEPDRPHRELTPSEPETPLQQPILDAPGEILDRRAILRHLGLGACSMGGLILATHALHGDPHLSRGLELVHRNFLGSYLREPRLPSRTGAETGPSRFADPLTPANYREFLATIPLRYLTIHQIVRPHFNVRAGIANEFPPPSLWRNILPVLTVAEELRHRLGVRLLEVTSAYRSPEYNAQIQGAAEGSYHTRNQALDLKFRCPVSRVAEVAHQLRDEKRFQGGIGLYPSFIHIDTRGTNVDWGSTAA